MDAACAAKSSAEQLHDRTQSSPYPANGTIEGFVIQRDVFERDLSFADSILKQKQVDAGRMNHIRPKRSKLIRIGE